MPLDSRPACTEFVTRLGLIAGVEVVLPPSGMLDEYRRAANPAPLRDWLRRSATTADIAIVSVDMLIHGGLIASRHAQGQRPDVDATEALLREIKAVRPELRLYAFSIIPRLLLADSDENSWYQTPMKEYSVLKDQVLTFGNPADYARLKEYEAIIPARFIQFYEAMHEMNDRVNRLMADLAGEGILDGAVIGQDDAHPFGLANIGSRRIAGYVQRRPELYGRVFVTRGTDEVALTLLGHALARETGYRSAVHVMYSQPEAANIIMPYMPHTVSRTVAEKLALVGARAVEDPDEADFILYMHVGNRRAPNFTAIEGARRIREKIEAGHRVAVVDLSDDYSARQTLLPALIRHDVNLLRLAGYAGWNTTSNSVGTAVAQATLFTMAAGRTAGTDAALNVYKTNLEFTTARILDDYFFQKQVQAAVNSHLRERGINPYDLGPHRGAAEKMIQDALSPHTDGLLRRSYQGQTFTVSTASGPREYSVGRLSAEAKLPWPRTFEISLLPVLELREIK